MTGCTVNDFDRSGSVKCLPDYGPKARYYRITAFSSLPWGPVITSRIAQFLTSLLAISLCLSIGSYYLAEDGQVNYFPTYLAAIAFLGLWPFASTMRPVVTHPVLIVSAILLFYLALSPLWGQQDIAIALKFIGYALLLLAFVAGIPIAHARHARFLDGFITVMIAASVVCAAVSIHFFYNLEFNPGDDRERLHGLGRMGNPVVSALSFSVPLIFALHRTVIRTRVPERGLWALAAIILVYALILTGTRSIWIGLFAAALAGTMINHRLSIRIRLVLAATLLVTTGLAFLLTLGSGLFEELMRRSTSYRPEIWSGILAAFAGVNPLLGAGLDASSEVRDSGYLFEHPHSIYLATLFYGGYIGLLMLITLIITTARTLIRAPFSDWRAPATMTLAFAVTTLALDGNRVLEKMDYVWVVFWLPVAFAVCVSTRNVNAAEVSQE
ncbi:MAG: O-antigen ligase family protein [Pseudomonadales bacterium]